MNCYKSLTICYLIFLFSYCNSGTNIPKKDISKIEQYLECASENRRNKLMLADSCVNIAINLAEEINFDEGLVKGYKLKGNILVGKGELMNSLEWFDKAIVLAQSINDTLGHLGAKMNLGSIYSKIGEKEKSIKMLNELLLDFDNYKMEKGKVSVYLNLAPVYVKVGDYINGQNYYFKAEEILVRNKNKKAFSSLFLSLYSGLGNLFESLKDYEKALAYHNKSLKFVSESHYNAFLIYNNIGSTLTEMGRLEEAKPYFQKVINSNIARKSTKTHSFGHLAELYDENGEYDQAIKYCDLGLEFAKKNNFNNLELNLLGLKGEAYLKKGYNQKASELFSIVENGYSKSKELKHLASVKELLIKAHIGSCKTDVDIHKTFKEYVVLKDTLFNDKMLDRIEDLEIKHEAEKNKKNAKISESRAERNMYIGLMSSLITLLLLLFFYRERKAKKDQMVLKEGAIKAKEREKKLKETVAKLRAGDNHRTDNAFKRIIIELNRQADSTETLTTRVAINKARSLVNTSQVVHNILRKHDENEEINVPISLALENLCKELKLIFTNKKNIELNIDCEESIEVSQRVLQPLFLIVEELFTNAWKHAFEFQDNPKIELSLKNINDKFIRLSYQDNGKGLSKNIDFNKEDSEGLELIRHFTNSLGGKMEIDSSNGLTFNIDFDKGKIII